MKPRPRKIHDKSVHSISRAKTTDRFSNVWSRRSERVATFARPRGLQPSISGSVRNDSRPTSPATLFRPSPTYLRAFSIAMTGPSQAERETGEGRTRMREGEKAYRENQRERKRNESEERVKGILCVPVNLLAPVVLAVHDVGSLSIPIRSAVP